MNGASHFLSTHWFAAVLLVAGLIVGILALLRQRARVAGWYPLALLAGGLLLAGLGGCVLTPRVGLWLGASSLALLIVALLVLVLSGAWSEWIGYLLGASLALAVGGFLAGRAQDGLTEAYRLAASVEFQYPWWLLLLGLVPLLVLFSFRDLRPWHLLFFAGGYASAALGFYELASRAPLWLGWLEFICLGGSVIGTLFWLTYPRRSLAGLGPIRQWVALGLRCALVVLLTLALAEARLRHQTESTTVLFVVDRSLSIPEEPSTRNGLPIDLRWERIKKFINDAVAQRGSNHERDQAGLIVFGRRPRLELPPSDAPRFNFVEVMGEIDGNYTDIGAALKLALASFPENTGKRIVLLSDGNENLGNAEEQARLCKQNGVQIDVVPLAAGQRNENEVLVERIEAPAQVEQGSRLPIRVLVRSFNPNIVLGTLTLRRSSSGPMGGQAVDVPGSPRKNAAVYPGLNVFTFKQRLDEEQGSYTYEAEFLPEKVVSDQGAVLARGLPGDRVQNNRATTHVVAGGQRRILLIEPTQGEHQFLIDKLMAAGNTKFKVETIEVDQLPQEKDRLAVLLSNYDLVILANVAASDIGGGENEVHVGDRPGGTISEAQQEVIRSNTHDQGCGLIMIGGPNSFGAGGWQGTAVEKALPVDCDIKSVEVGGRGGLVLIMHASEIAEGNRWQKVIAKLAIQKLSSSDMVGVLYYDWTGAGGDPHKWHIPFQEVGEKRGRLYSLVDSMNPGDMPDVDPHLEKAHKELTKAEYGLATRHIIFISDGDHWTASPTLLAKLRASKITCTTVCITSHGQLEEQKMADMARRCAGRFYSVKNPNALPAIYTKETRIVSQSVIYEKKFQPVVRFRGGPTESLPESLPPLYGFVRTTAKQNPLVELPITSPPIAEQQFPILAYWHYGLGKSAAFTSDARSQKDKVFWDRDWASSGEYAKFWEQLVEWSLRPVESKRLTMTTEYRDGRVRVVVEARDENGRPLTNLQLRGGVTTPGDKPDEGQRTELRFEQKNSGQYEAEFKAEESGSYFVNAAAIRKRKVTDKEGNVKGEVDEVFDSVRSGVTIPYSPEFSDQETNVGLLESLRTLTGGNVYRDDGAVLASVASSGEVFRPGLPRFYSLQPIWYWLLLAVAVLLFFDVAVRRIAVDPLQVVVAAQGVWERLRGRTVAVARAPEFFERLRSRKAQVSEDLERGRAARRFEGGDVPASAPPGPDVPTTPAAPSGPRPSAPRPTLGPQEAPAEPGDFGSRLLRAKKKVWEERDKDKGKDQK